MTLTPAAPTRWPPPPDLASLQELVRDADIESFISLHGAPPDEYDTEADLLFVELENLTAADLVPARILPILEDIWPKNFSLSPEEALLRRPALLGLARQISRFFGPEATPQTRTAPGTPSDDQPLGTADPQPSNV